MTNTLTQSAYEARLADLAVGITDAEQALSQASFKATTGFASQEDVDNARGHLTALQQQRDDLSRAWEVQKEHNRQASKERSVSDWQSVVGTIEALIEQQLLDEQAIARAIKTLGECYRRHIAASEEMKGMLKPYFHGSGAAGLDRLRNMMETVAPAVAAIRFTIAGAMSLEKIDLSGVNVDAAEQRIRAKGIFDHTEYRVGKIRSLLELNTVD